MKIENAWVLASNKNILSKVKDALRMKGSNHDKASQTVLSGPPSPQAKAFAVVTTQCEESKVSTYGKNQALLSRNGCNSDYYIEETAWRSFSNAVQASYHADNGGDLLPLLPPAPLSKFPQTGYCTWTFNEQSRVVLGCFWNEGEFVGVNDEDREFLFNMMERKLLSWKAEKNSSKKMNCS